MCSIQLSKILLKNLNDRPKRGITSKTGKGDFIILPFYSWIKRLWEEVVAAAGAEGNNVYNTR